MISEEEFYKVMCAMVPLYFAMVVAYGSVRWWKIFTAEQCSGINRFVAVFAVPFLSFHFISQNDPYEMDSKFILADTLSKALVLLLLSLWAVFFSAGGSLDWLITVFSLATLPNTLVMGIPLLQAMYGGFTQSLMVQIVVLQCIIWYTLLLFLLEYRAATLLIQARFPGPAAASISGFHVDADVVSLDGEATPLRADPETDSRGRVRVRIRIRRSDATSSEITAAATPRVSDLSNAEVFSVNTPVSAGPHCNYGGASSDACHSLQPSPRASNFDGGPGESSSAATTPTWTLSPAAGRVLHVHSPSPPAVAWDSPAKLHGQHHHGFFKDVINNVNINNASDKEASFRENIKIPIEMEEMNNQKTSGESQEMPNPLVMLRLILIVVGRKLSRNPNTYSSVIGLLWSLISFKWNVGMPTVVKYSIKIISDAGLGMAMFSLGLFMALQPRIIACGTKRATMAMFIRFICGPIVMTTASILVGLRGVKLHAAIVQAALPQGIVPFVFAREYGLHPDILSTGVIFGMLVSLPVTLLYYILLGV